MTYRRQEMLQSKVPDKTRPATAAVMIRILTSHRPEELLAETDLQLPTAATFQRETFRLRDILHRLA